MRGGEVAVVDGEGHVVLTVQVKQRLALADIAERVDIGQLPAPDLLAAVQDGDADEAALGDAQLLEGLAVDVGPDIAEVAVE